MDHLPHHPLTSLALTVDFANIVPIGATAAGHRSIASVTGGSFSGARLSGTVLPGGQDWVVTRADGTLAIDVRLTLKTDDGVSIYLTYQGNFLAAPAVLARFRKGEALDPAEYTLRTVARFECGDPRYSWLNDSLVIGIGEQTPAGPVYHLFEVG